MSNIIQLDSPRTYFTRLKDKRDITRAKVVLTLKLHTERTVEQLIDLLTPDELSESYQRIKEMIADERMETIND